MSTFDFSGLRPIRLSDRALFAEKLAIKDHRSCELAFANLFLWSAPYRVEFMECHERLVVFERVNGVMHYPIGEDLPPAGLAELLRAGVAAEVASGGIYDVPEEYCERFPEAEEYFEVETDEGSFDYLYDLAHLAEMAGPLLRKKRNLIRQFEREYPGYELADITPENLGEAIDFAEKLNARMPDVTFLGEETETLEMTRKYFHELGMRGTLLRVGGQTIGFSIYSDLNSDTADIHFEKADHTFKGAPQFLTAAVAERLLRAGRRYMNREQDMDEPGLRQAKRSLDPAMMIRRKFLTLRELA